MLLLLFSIMLIPWETFLAKLIHEEERNLKVKRCLIQKRHSHYI
jgi:hypothetical protein